MSLNSLNATIQNISLEAQVAQRLMLGFSGTTPTPWLRRFLEAGLGGVIFFKENVAQAEAASNPAIIKELLAEIRALQTPHGFPPLLLSVDQEGGRVERLGPQAFPSLPSPRAVAETGSVEFAKMVYDTLASHLQQLGFTMNFAPCLDVNLNPANPIIGPRAFGETSEAVSTFGDVALRAHQAHGLVPVIKHFPGHGNGSVDSHHTLPRLELTEAELSTFRQAMDAGAPVVMVSHGHYPALQREPQPASLDPVVGLDLLRGRCGFGGVSISDDLYMGAITEQSTPVDTALRAMAAGMDILLYRQSSETEWEILQALVDALQTGRLDRHQHEAALGRILQLKASLPAPYAGPLYTAAGAQGISQSFLKEPMSS